MAMRFPKNTTYVVCPGPVCTTLQQHIHETTVSLQCCVEEAALAELVHMRNVLRGAAHVNRH